MTESLFTKLEELLAREAERLVPDGSHPGFSVTEPNLPEHGDAATNIALSLGKFLKRSPMAIAEEIVQNLAKQNDFTIKVATPGFINFFFKDDFLVSRLPALQKKKGAKKKKEKIVIEHTDVNPNKAMHIGHLRNAVLGDVITRVLQRVGFATEVQYYVDDTGVQVADTYLGFQELGLKQEPGEKYDHFCWRVYAAINRQYEKDPSLLEKRTKVLHAIEDRSSATARAVKELATRIVNDHLRSMADFSIAYDLLVWESDILGFKFWEHTFAILQKSPHVVKETSGTNAGCWVLKTGEEQVDDEHSPDKILVKTDGTITYTGKDIAYHLWKFNLLGKDFLYSDWKKAPQETKLATTSKEGTKSSKYGHADRVYNVIDVRQSYPQAMVQLALESLGFVEEAEKFRHVSYNVVSLSQKTATTLGADIGDNKRSQSMSGRKGLGVKVDAVLTQLKRLVEEQKYAVKSERDVARATAEEVAVGALKYFMLRYNPQTEIVFDFDEALSLEGNTGPYIQYAHARAAGILAKSGEKKFPMPKHVELEPAEHRLLARLFQWPIVLEQVADDLNVSRISTYAFSLADAFNGFYEACPVLKSEGNIRARRLALVHAYKYVLGDVFSVLGIASPEQM
ncbi:MAG: arginine--tRNA ligase [Candidatus Komeilibacteria bacterium]|nr:arginine--tRNA ligase [Candidatus Komeilibacteria bacterium]